MSDAVHREIAKERFLELMAQEPKSDPTTTAVLAIGHADAFVRAYAACGQIEAPLVKKQKGCKACFGSGGKSSEPCKVCHGTGRVAA